MTWGVLNAAMLLGLAGAAIPVAIHLLSRRDEPVVDWAAMRFLELAPSERRRIRFADALLMLARMAPLALAALALARPFWTPRPATSEASATSRDVPSASGTDVRRDVVLILDGSASMGRRGRSGTPRDRAIAWARRFVGDLGPGDSVAVVVAGGRARPLVDPPAFDLGAVDRALADAPGAKGSGDLAAAVGETFRILEKAGNPARDVVLLTDGRRSAWRPDEAGRWSLLRDLRRRMAAPPRLWSVAFASGGPDDAGPPDGSVGPVTLSRAVATPGLEVEASATIANAGPGPMTRGVGLVVDGQPVPGASRVVGPIPPGGRTPVSFRTSFDALGSHLIAVRLAPAADPRPDDDEAAHPARVAPPTPVLLVEGPPGGATAFLRAALAPAGDRSPAYAVGTLPDRDLGPDSLEGREVAVLADVAPIGPEDARALASFAEGGGGLLLVPGPQVAADPDAWARAFGRDGLPATLGVIRGDPARREPVAHPAPRSFVGPALAPLGRGDAPSLAAASFFAYHPMTPARGTSVPARLDSGDPWIVERARGRGRIALLSTPLDAAAGTLVANPDFVPWAHALIASLAASPAAPRPLLPGEPLSFDLDPPPPPDVATLPLALPSGRNVAVPVARSGATARVVFPDTDEPGAYRLDLPDRSLYASVAADPRESDPTPLTHTDVASLSAGWPLRFAPAPDLTPLLLDGPGPPPRSEATSALILLALAGLCLEILLTRRLARTRGV